MNKLQFICELYDKLRFLPEDEIEDRISFYTEMIDDRIEEGFSEDEAVAAVGGVDCIAEQIIAEIPLSRIAKKNLKPKRRLRAWEIVLIVAGSPLWIALGAVLFAVVLAVYVSFWAVIISLWAVFASLAACALGFVFGGVVIALCDSVPVGVAVFGAGLVLAGLSVFFFYGCKAATKGILFLSKKTGIGMKKCFIKKEAV